MRRMYSHPAEYRNILLANYLCIGFVPGGMHSPVSAMAQEVLRRVACKNDQQMRNGAESMGHTFDPNNSAFENFFFWREEKRVNGRDFFLPNVKIKKCLISFSAFKGVGGAKPAIRSTPPPKKNQKSQNSG